MQHDPLATSGLFLLVLAAALPVHAAPPDAGQLSREAPALGTLPRPADAAAALPALPRSEAVPAAPGAEARRLVRRVAVTGSTVIAAAELAQLAASGLGADGRALTLAEMQGLAAAVTRRYRDAGYPLARAYLPVQDLAGGELKIVVLEGLLSRVDLRNPGNLAPRPVADLLGALRVDAPLADAELERSLLLANELPGLSLRATLQPGATVGTTELLVEVEPGRAVQGEVSLDNFGNRSTGATRLNGALDLNNPLNQGDVLSLRAASAGSAYQFARAAWQLPLGASGLQVGIASSWMHYRLGGAFAELEADGSAFDHTLYASLPLLRNRTDNVRLTASLDAKRLRNDIAQTDTRGRRTVRVLNAGANGQHVDDLGGGGEWRWSATATAGRLGLDAEAAALDADGHRTQGRFAKWQLQVTRAQRLGADWQLVADLSGQGTGNNLDSSEKMAFGGPAGLRGYPTGEAHADQGVQLLLELRRPLVQGLASQEVV